MPRPGFLQILEKSSVREICLEFFRIFPFVVVLLAIALLYFFNSGYAKYKAVRIKEESKQLELI